jgi:capsular polysaccharide biosynthesis protein
MNAPVWRVEDDGAVQLPLSPTTEAGLVSLPFLVAAVRRGWRRVVTVAGVCAFLALSLTQVMGGQPAARVTLLVVSDPTTDPSSAMLTNLSLLNMRAVSQQVITLLHLPLTPEDFQGSVKGGQLSDQLMTATVTAPSDQEAIKRADTLAKVYLDFRAQQLSSSADSTIEADQQLVDSLNQKIDDLTKRADAASATSGQEQAAMALLNDRAQLQSKVDATEAEIEATRIQNQAIIGASHVVESPSIVQKSRLKRAALAVVTGLIGGTALGLMWVLLPAVLSTRLRRRDDVARALGLPVRFSAGRVRGRWWWLPGRWDRRNAERLAHGLATTLPEEGDTARLTVATIGDVGDGAYVVGALADELARESTRVAVVDLSSSSVLDKPSRFRLGRRDPIRNRQLVKVRRHDVRVSELAARSRNVASDKDLGKAEVILTLIELDLGSGVDMLGDLADVTVVLVSAGRTTAERLRSSAVLLRQSQIHPAFAMLVGADDSDDSSGLLDPVGDRDASARRSS